MFGRAPSIHTFFQSASPTTLLARRHIRPLCLCTASPISYNGSTWEAMRPHPRQKCKPMKTYFCLVTNQDKSKFRKCRPTLFIVQPSKRNNPILFTAHRGQLYYSDNLQRDLMDFLNIILLFQHSQK